MADKRRRLIMSVQGGFEIPFYNPWCQGDQIIRVNDRDLTHSTQVSDLNKLGCIMPHI